METFPYIHTPILVNALETSLVEWKQGLRQGRGNAPEALETSLVEWKPISFKMARFPDNSLGNFLSGMETPLKLTRW